MYVSSVISLGSWCRCAFQVRNRYKEANAYPFDWTITPYISLKMFFEGDNNARVQFCDTDVDRLEVNKYGSLTDVYTQIIHHHSFGKHEIAEYMLNGKFQKSRFSNSTLMHNVKQKRDYLFNRFLHDINSKNIIYYRWMRSGHPDKEIATVFDGENTRGLYDLLRNNTASKNIRLVHLVSNVYNVPAYIDDNAPLVNVLDFESDKYILMEISERSWKSDNAFQGDTEAWGAMFEEVEQMMGLDIRLTR